MNRERRSPTSARLAMLLSSEDRRRFHVDHSDAEMDKVYGTIGLPSIITSTKDVRKCFNRYYGLPTAYYPFRVLQAFVDYKVWSGKSDREIDGFTDPFSIETDLQVLEIEFPKYSNAFAYVRERGGFGPSRVIPMKYPPEYIIDNLLKTIRPTSGIGSRLYNPAVEDYNNRRISLTMSMNDRCPGAFNANEFGLRRPMSLHDMTHVEEGEVRTRWEAASTSSTPMGPPRYDVVAGTVSPAAHFPSPSHSAPGNTGRFEEQSGPDWTLTLDRQLSLHTAESSENSCPETPTHQPDLVVAHVFTSNMPGGSLAEPSVAPPTSPYKAKATRAATSVGPSLNLNRYALLNRALTEPGASPKVSSHRFPRSFSGLMSKMPSRKLDTPAMANANEAGVDLAPLSPSLRDALSLPRNRRGHMRSTSSPSKPAPPEGAAAPAWCGRDRQ